MSQRRHASDVMGTDVCFASEMRWDSASDRVMPHSGLLSQQAQTDQVQSSPSHLPTMHEAAKTQRLTLTSNMLTILSRSVMASPVLVPAAPAGGPCFMSCHCLKPELRYDCTRLRVLTSCTRAIDSKRAALMGANHAAGTSSGSSNKGVNCMQVTLLSPTVLADSAQMH